MCVDLVDTFYLSEDVFSSKGLTDSFSILLSASFSVSEYISSNSKLSDSFLFMVLPLMPLSTGISI